MLWLWYLGRWRDRATSKARARRDELETRIDELEGQLGAESSPHSEVTWLGKLSQWFGLRNESPKRFMLVSVFLIFGPILCILFTCLLWTLMADSDWPWWGKLLAWLYGAVGGAMFNGWLLSMLVWSGVLIGRHVHRTRKFNRRIAKLEAQLRDQ